MQTFELFNLLLVHQFNTCRHVDCVKKRREGKREKKNLTSSLRFVSRFDYLKLSSRIEDLFPKHYVENCSI